MIETQTTDMTPRLKRVNWKLANLRHANKDFCRIGLDKEGAMARSQEILDELNRRLGERTRPMAERDYLERLLRRF